MQVNLQHIAIITETQGQGVTYTLFIISSSINVNANISDMFSRNGLKRNTHHGLMDQDM